METQSNSPKYTVQTLEKALEVIEFMNEGFADGVRIKDISQALGIGKSTVHRILNTLVAHGYVEQSPSTKKYLLSWKLFEIGSTVLRQRKLNTLDMKPMWDLCYKVEETVNLGVRTHDKVAIIAKTDLHNNIFRVGPCLGEHEPLHATAMGKVLISELNDEELAFLFKSEELEKYTAQTVTSLQELKKQLRRIREEGYAVDEEELCVGLTCVGMPVRNYQNQIIAAMSISGPSIRLNFNKLLAIKEDLKLTCDTLSNFFGFDVSPEKVD